MKKLLVIGFILCLGSLSATDLKLITGFKLGYILEDMTKINYTSDRNDNCIRIELISGVKLGNLRLKGTYENILNYISLDVYNPRQDKYTVELSYTLENFILTALHYCSHPVVPQGDDRINSLNYGRTEFSIAYYKEF